MEEEEEETTAGGPDRDLDQTKGGDGERKWWFCVWDETSMKLSPGGMTT
jgi:hypothetical protein